MKNKPSNVPVRRADPVFRAAGASPPGAGAPDSVHGVVWPSHSEIARRGAAAEAKPEPVRPPVAPQIKPMRGPTPLETLHGALRRRIALTRPSPPSE